MKSVYEVRFYFGQIGSTTIVSSQFLPACFCKPSILEALVFSHKAIFCTCEKYGCKQINPWPKGVRPEFYKDYLTENTDRFSTI